MRPRHRILALVAVLAAVPAAARAQTVQYAYDDAGRLSVVADPRGDLAVYDYDPAGNLVAIRRLTVADVPGVVAIALVSPGAARRGATVSIFGKGFAPAPDANVVTFDGARAEVLTAAATRLTVTVPARAVTGPIRVDAPLGGATSPEPFRVLGALTITPASAVVASRGTVRFSAAEDGVATADVRWSVDGLVGGDATRGTVGADGAYVAPASLPAAGVAVGATSTLDPGLTATVPVTMVAARPFFATSRPLAVGGAPPAPRAEVTAIASVGVATAAAFAAAAPLALDLAPIVTAIAPAEGARGQTVRVTVNGRGLEGVTHLEFLDGTGADSALTVTGLAVSADGTEASADVHIAAGAAVGPRIVRVVTSARSSGTAARPGNVFIVH